MAIVVHVVLVLVDLPVRQIDADDCCHVLDGGIGVVADSR